jgi:hypothetical protein
MPEILERGLLWDFKMDDLQLDRFLLSAAQNIGSGPEINSPTYKCIKEIDDHWLGMLFVEGRHGENQAVCALMANAHNIFRACTSLIFSGQPTPVYALLRTSLESCLYALMIAEKPELEIVWLHRSRDEAGKETCKKEFTANKVFKNLERLNPGLNRACRAFYDTYIDYGAHPNIFGTFTFIQPVHGDEKTSVSVNYLQGSSREVRIAAYCAVQLAEAALHLSIHAMPNRTAKCKTKNFLDEFSPRVNLQLFGLQ